MKNKIPLNDDIGIDTLKLIEGGLVILANSGGGKSYAIRKIAEGAVDQIQTIILDPEGEFASLREKYDFILAGKNADVPVEVRSAALLATKLLELRKSAVIDLYELHPSERQRYVKLFCDALVNAPKNLYHPVAIILDEAHEYVPEGKPSEATWAVEALASKGRKRGFRLIPASQRVSKLSKNVSAECNNKLIGRMSQDIDMKRAGDELGFTKEKLVQIRQLKPGEFFAFGPAISDEVIKVKIGEVKTSHAKASYRKSKRLPPPSHVIKKVLGELADLPQEAAAEAKTIADFKAEIIQLKRKLTQLPKQKETLVCDPSLISKEVVKAVNEVSAKRDALEKKDSEVIVKEINETQKILDRMAKLALSKMKHPLRPIYNVSGIKLGPKIIPGTIIKPRPDPGMDKIIMDTLKHGFKGTYVDSTFDSDGKATPINSKFGPGELAILTALGQYPEGLERENLTVITGYKRSSRDAYIYRLQQRGFIGSKGSKFAITENGIESLGLDYKPLPTGQALRDHLIETLPVGEKKILIVLMDRYPEPVSKEELTQETGYARSSRDAYIYRLQNRQLIKSNGIHIIASDKLYD